MAGLYYEQFEIGQVLRHDIHRTVTEADNVWFSALTYNPARLHLDAEYCRSQTEFAYEEKGIIQFPIEVAASGVTSAVSYFASDQLTRTVAFPRYRVRFYNTCEKSVTVNLYAYLTN